MRTAGIAWVGYTGRVNDTGSSPPSPWSASRGREPWRDDAPSIRAVGGAAKLSLLVQVGGRPLQLWVEGEGEVPGLPFRLQYSQKGGQGYVVRTPGQEVLVTREQPSSLTEQGVDVHARIVRRFWLPRWFGEQGDLILPVIALAVAVITLQLQLLASAMSPPEGGGGFEPSPEYLQRLLKGDYGGAEKGLLAKPELPRPSHGDPIESFYLQPGHGGPLTRMGGGKNVGDHVASGNPDPPPRRAKPVPVGAGELDPEPVQPEVMQDDGTVADATPDDEKATDEDQPVAVHVTEGWGLNDWYDTEDARQDAKEIQQELDLARQILKLDPDDPTGLNILAYYQYLAMDYTRAEKVYTRMTVLNPDDAAGWNNLALTFKRRKDYVTEEKYYRIALELSPMDDHAMNNLAVCLAHQGRFDEALKIMDDLETIIPDDAYADLHRAKIYAAMGKDERAYKFLEKSLRGMRKLDTLHNIEYRQDIRIDPAFEKLRKEERFRSMLMRYYGDEADGWWKKVWK